MFGFPFRFLPGCGQEIEIQVGGFSLQRSYQSHFDLVVVVGIVGVPIAIATDVSDLDFFLSCAVV